MLTVPQQKLKKYISSTGRTSLIFQWKKEKLCFFPELACEPFENKMSNNSVKQENQDQQERRFITLKVVGQDGTEMHFRVNVEKPLGKLKTFYTSRLGVPAGSFRFLFDGHRINDNETPTQLDMQHNDLVEVYQEQTGGEFCKE